MNIFVLNAGSSSLKFQLISMPSEIVQVKGVVDGIGQEECFLLIHRKGGEFKKKESVQDHEVALNLIFERLKDDAISAGSVQGIGHRVVHGGEKYRSATLVTDQVQKDIDNLSDIAPLHNPANAAGIRACQKLLPNVPNVAVFDTAFHQTLPPVAYLYGLPYELYEKYGIRKYGFHGISHEYVSGQAMKILKETIKDFKILSCHLGSGASICAIRKGKSVEISMGFTPLEGLMMGTRSGSFDPEIVIYLQRKGYTMEQVEDMMLKRGGLMGISQTSNDVRDLREDELTGEPRSELAFEMFVYRVRRFIGSYCAVLGGLDILIFTGGMGESAYYIRRRICEVFGYLGLKLDVKKNRTNETIISSGDSQVTVMVVPTNEELQIARECVPVLERKKR